MTWTRRDFVKCSAVVAGVAALGPTSCSSGSDSDADELAEEDEGNAGVAGEGPLDGVIVDADVPTGATLFGWINEIHERGVRRPGYEADEWTEVYIAEHLRSLGLQQVRSEPVELTRWEPEEWKLEVLAEGEDPVELDCYPLAYAPPVDDLDVELVAFNETGPGRVAGKAALCPVELPEVAADHFLSDGGAPDDLTGRRVGPESSFEDVHLLPATLASPPVGQAEVAGAAAFIGSLSNLPGDSHEHYLPLPGRHGSQPGQGIPGVWVSETDRAWLSEQLAEGPVRVRLSVDSRSEPVRSHNVVGELPGADDEVVMICSHHDGPWASAVEGASGTVLVLAQAAYWAAQPEERRPHRLVFVLHAGHMVGSAGTRSYVEAHREALDDVVLQVQLEHAGLECREDDGSVVPTGQPVPRWFFTSRIARLEQAVMEALEIEALDRSMLLAPDAVGPDRRPPTDGGLYYEQGVPVMHFSTAPFYLYDASDNPDKVDKENLVPLTRATIRIVDATSGASAAAMRAVEVRPD